MPRQRLTPEQAEASGAIEHNPKRFADRIHAPQPAGPVGDPPNFFDDEQGDVWREILELAPLGVLTSADRLLVETTVYLVRMQRMGLITSVDRGHLRACLGSMGMTPADRTRVQAASGGKKERDPLDILLGANGSGKAN